MNNKIVKTLIPVVAVIVIFESIMLVSNLEKNVASSTASDITSAVNKTETITKAEVKAFELSFVTETKEMKVGKKYKVSLDVTPSNDSNLNALDLYVKFDPAMVTISNLVSGKELAKPDFIKVSDKKNVIVENFLFSAKEGAVFTKGKETNLLTFTVTPKKLGSSSFEISTGDSEGDSVTMFVDKVTSKGLPFSSSKLEINLMN
jgi:hypothetical protein